MKIIYSAILTAMASVLFGCGGASTTGSSSGSISTGSSNPGSSNPISSSSPKTNKYPHLENVSSSTSSSTSSSSSGLAVSSSSSGALTGDQFIATQVNPFVATRHDPFSTFAIDVDTASYDVFYRGANDSGSLPVPDSVRIEEYVNYFKYNYPAPALDAVKPFSVTMTMVPNILDRATHIVRVGLKAAAPPKQKKPVNLVFLVDVSGSMNGSDRLPLVKLLIKDTLPLLEPDDHISIVSYSSDIKLVLPSTAVVDKNSILTAVDSLVSYGSTNGGAGIQLAYKQTQTGYINGGINHIVLCTDGDFNVGTTTDDELVKLIETERKTGVTLTSLGFGTGNLNDAMMEKTSNAGNGIYSVITSEQHVHRYAEDRLLSNLQYVAKDVKIQMEFNPDLIGSYRLLGYEDRDIADKDFRNDKVDAGEIGAGHTVTALYEVVLRSNPQPTINNAPKLKDGAKFFNSLEGAYDDLVMAKVRYKDVDASATTQAKEFSISIKNVEENITKADADLRWALAIASYAEILRHSPFADKKAISQLESIFKEQSTLDNDRKEFYQLYLKTKPVLTAAAVN
ncbi:MAG TPA: von Willebrand factor type A domain-containing protein [Cellvibrionaceae bacterium]